MPRIIDLLDYLPPVLSEIDEVQHLARTENPEFNLLWEAFERLMKDQFITEATESGIARWEKILNIHPSSDSTLEDRRWEILNRTNMKIPYTMTMLKNKLNLMYGGNVKVELISDTYTLIVRIPISEVKQLETVRNMLNVIVPANLFIDLGLF